MSVLDDIVEAARRREVRVDEGRLNEALGRPTRPLARKAGGNTIIAELKYASPSEKRVFSEGKLEDVVASYEAGGASALSILTEPVFFGGRPEFIGKAKNHCSLPILRKDFLLDEDHLRESRVLGADGILLIACVLGDKLSDMIAKANSLGLWALVETHDGEEIGRALSAGARIVGVNNRNLATLEVDLKTSVRLCERIPEDVFFVAESGIKVPEDIKYLKENCARPPDAFLVGGTLMKAEDKKSAVKKLVDA